MDEMQAEAIAGFARAALDGGSGTALVDVGQSSYVVTIDETDQASVEAQTSS